jgi:hypothetical protein
MTLMARNETDGAERWLADLPPSAGQTRSAIAVVAVVIIAFAAVVPFSGIPLARLNILFPLLDAIVFVTDLITGSPAVCAVFDFARTRAPGAGEWISLYGADRGAPCPDLLRCVFADRTSRCRYPDRIMAFHLLASGFRRGPAGLCSAQDTKARRARFRDIGAPRDWLECCGRRCSGLRSDMAFHRGSDALPAIVLDQTRISPFVVYPISFTILISQLHLPYWPSAGPPCSING